MKQKNLRIPLLLSLLPLLTGLTYQLSYGLCRNAIMDAVAVGAEHMDISVLNAINQLGGIITAGLLPIVSILLAGMLLAGRLNLYHTSLFTLLCHAGYAFGMRLVYNLTAPEPSFSVGGWLWIFQETGETNFVIFFAAVLLWAILQKQLLPGFFSALWLLARTVVFPVLIALQTYAEVFSGTNLLLDIYDTLTVSALLFMAFFIFLTRFIRRRCC